MTIKNTWVDGELVRAEDFNDLSTAVLGAAAAAAAAYKSADTIVDGTTNKVLTAADKTRLANTSGTNTGDQTTITGNAGTATKLATARNIAGVPFDGSAAIALTQDNIGDGSSNRSYTAAEKTKLAAISGTNTGDQTSVSGNAGTATKLATARTINGVAFDGTANITVADSTKEATANKGAVNGYAPLDASALVPAVNLPSYVDDVLEYTNFAAFPGTGTTGKIFVALDTGKIFRWSGSAYVEISPSPGSTDSVTEGSSNLYFTNARADARVAAAAASGTGSLVRATSPTITTPTITNYVETAQSIATVTTTKTLDPSAGTIIPLRLTASTACTVTMPTAAAGKSLLVPVYQAASTGNGTVTFTGVKWAGGTTPTMTATAGRMDLFAFWSDGTNWYGSVTQNYTP